MIAAAAAPDAAFPVPDTLADAILAARMCALDPLLGGMVLRGEAAAREAVLAAWRAALPAGAPWRRLPAGADETRLIGGLDLAAALAGRAEARPGLLAEADGGGVVVPMAERLGAAAAAALCAALDTGETVAERDGASLRTRARIMVAALDDGVGDERVPPALAERLAFRCDVAGFGPRDAARIAAAPARVAPPDAAVLGAIGATAAALGVDSARAALFALRAARASAALAGRGAIAEADVAIAARLVLAPRATQLPAAPDAPAPPAPAEPQAERAEEGAEEGEGGTLDDRIVAATRAALPPDVLARIAADLAGGGEGRRARGIGERRRARAHGRPAGVRAGKPGGGARLALVATLRAAAPWQRLRGRDGRIEIRTADLRIRRFEAVSEIVTIFAVDASGSAALARLAEAKGAVELLLGQAYVQRAEVALVAFRGTGAELLLPPTRSLARARRALAELPGGGGTPIAAGLAAAAEVARAAAARGRTPFLVILSDGRGNIALDGSAGRGAAETDALAAARAIAAAGLRALFIDTSPRPRPEASRLAAAMRGRYLALPRLDAGAVQAAVNAARPARG